MIYQEAAEKVFAQGIVAGIANAVTVAIAGTLLLLAYSRTQTRSGSLKRINIKAKAGQPVFFDVYRLVRQASYDRTLFDAKILREETARRA